MSATSKKAQKQKPSKSEIFTPDRVSSSTTRKSKNGKEMLTPSLQVPMPKKEDQIDVSEEITSQKLQDKDDLVLLLYKRRNIIFFNGEEGLIPIDCANNKGKVVAEERSGGEDQHSLDGSSTQSRSASEAASQKLSKWYPQTMKECGVSSTCQDLERGVKTRRQGAVQNPELNLELNYALMVVNEPMACAKAKKHKEQVQSQAIGLIEDQQEDILKKALNRKKFKELPRDKGNIK
eukprot:Gb_21170 [translate_table: standard]